MRPMREDAPSDPMRSARANMRPEPVRRFYGAVDVREADGGFALTLDGRIARTPGRNRLVARTRDLMLRAAEEWARQGETLDPSDMPVTRLLNSALDGVARALAATRDGIAAYAGSDLVCYRAETPEALAERQRAAFDPVLDWTAKLLGGRFVVAGGVMPVAQPAETLAAFRASLETFDDPVALAALSAMTSLTGSALLAHAVAQRCLDPAEAWRLAHLDEDFQNERWGVDDEARARRASRWREMEAAATALRNYAENKVPPPELGQV
jgi:chaperone required for assembly of F1-ATPase